MNLPNNTHYMEDGCDAGDLEILDCPECGVEFQAGNGFSDGDHVDILYCSEQCFINYSAGRAERHLDEMGDR